MPFNWRDILRNKIGHNLSAGLAIADAGSYFYQIGVYLPAAYHPAKVSRYGCRPWISVVVCLFVIFRSIFVLLCPDEIPHLQQQLLFYLGDISLIINLRFHFSLLLITFAVTVIGIQYIHYRASHISSKSLQVKLLDINPINLITGKMTPQQVGIHNSALVAGYLRRAFHAIRLCNFLRVNLIVIVPIAYFIVLFYRYMQPQFHTIEGLLCAILHPFVYMIYSDYFYSFTLYHMLYLYLVCEYLKIRMKQMIYDLDSVGSGISQNVNGLRLYWFHRLVKLLNELHSIQHQVEWYNATFWSSIVFVFFVCFVINVSVFVYITIYSSIQSVVRICCVMVVLTEITIFCTILYSCSIVNTTSKKVYLKLNSSYLVLDNKCLLSPRIREELRNRKTNLKQTESLIKLKIPSWIGVFANKNFGFTCGHFVPINYRISLEIVIFMISVFLRLVKFRFNSGKLF